MNREISGLLGMCRRAGRLITGFDAVMSRLAVQRPALIMTACDLSPKTEKELRFSLESLAGTPPPTVRLPLTKQEIGEAIGQLKAIGLLATNDAGLAAAILKKCPMENEEVEAL